MKHILVTLSLVLRIPRRSVCAMSVRPAEEGSGPAGLQATGRCCRGAAGRTCHPPTAIGKPPTAVPHPPTAVGCQPVHRLRAWTLFVLGSQGPPCRRPLCAIPRLPKRGMSGRPAQPRGHRRGPDNWAPPGDALQGNGPQRRPQKRLDRRLEEVAEAVGGGYCRL